jgi:hypothetical protein
MYLEEQAYLVECSLKENVEGRLEQLGEILLFVDTPRASRRIVA